MVVSVDLVNSSARHSFERSTETIVGRATHRIVGGPAGLDERLYTRLRVDQGMRAIAPVIEARVTLEKEQKTGNPCLSWSRPLRGKDISRVCLVQQPAEYGRRGGAYPAIDGEKYRSP